MAAEGSAVGVGRRPVVVGRTAIPCGRSLTPDLALSAILALATILALPTILRTAADDAA